MQIYGIDLSKEKFDVFYLNSNKEEKSKTVKNNLAEISKFLLKLPKNVCLCAEHTGCYGDLLVHSCNQMEIPISLIPGYTIKHSLGISRGKSDPIDARKVREYGIRFSDKLKMTIYHTEDLAELREYHALRSQLVKTKKILLTSEKGRKHLPFQSIGVHKHNKTALDTIKAEIKAVEQEIEKIILHNNELANSLKLATSIQGIGPVIATELIIKTGNFKVINTAKKAASYAGVCPFPNSSGKMMGKSKVSNLADKKLKSLLYMGAKAAVKHNSEYNLYFQRKTLEGKHYFLIMNNVSNKLLRTVYSVVNNNKPYDKNYICKDPREKLITSSKKKVA
ncbi:MAG: IS110 family transposase [Bacteroidetes bacterium]|nr:MAG: IS110 family transposase [Bacteroidota bacterium]